MYIIRRYRNTEKSLILETMGLVDEKHDFFIATNNTCKFNSPIEASEYFKIAEFNCLVGCNVFIEGPRGGIYRIDNGKPYK